jgi:acetylornithine deacetylase
MTIERALAGEIRDAVKAMETGAVDFLCDLVREDSLLGQEQGAQDRMADAFEHLGLEVERFEIDLEAIRHLPGFSPPVIDNYTGRQNVVGLHRPKGGGGGRSLILNGHIDVVPTGPAALWTAPPFAPRIEDGKVYGRGAGDMKAGIVAYCLAYEALGALGYRPAAPVIMQSVIEEECTGNGALACLARGYRADAAIIPEPFNQTLMVAQLGVMWLTIDLVGKPAHVQDTAAGINAIEAAHALFDSLRGLEAMWNRTGSRHVCYQDHAHPVNFNLGKVSGGEWASSVPCAASIDVRVGFYPGMTIPAVKRAIQATIDTALRERVELKGARVTVSYKGFQAEGCTIDPDAPLMTGLADAHRLVTNAPIELQASTATTDARFFVLYGDTPATCYGPVAGNYHGLDEWVSIDSMLEVAQVLAVFMAGWCGLEKAA